MQEQVHGAPQFLAQALAQVDDAVIIVDNEQRITYLNAKAAVQYEVAEAEALGKPLSHLHQHQWLSPGDDEAAYQALAQNGHWRGRNIHRLAGGRELHVESTVTALRDDAGRQVALLAVIRDITAQKQAETALRELQEWQRLALEGARLGVWSVDLATGATIWDARSHEIFGDNGSEPANSEQYAALIYPEDRARVLAAFAAVADPASDGLYEVENRIVWPDGSIHWIATRGQVFFEHANGVRTGRRLAGVVMDISERKEQESQLWQANRRAQLAESAAHGFMYEWDPQTRKAVRLAGLHQVLGYHPEELDNDIDAWRALIHPDDFDDVSSQGFAAMDLSGQYALEYRLRHRAGHYIHVLDQGIAERGDDGQWVRIAGITTDISERKQAEAELRRNAEQLRGLSQSLQELNNTLEQRVAERTADLERSNRELDQFAYVASHDLKAPLRAIDNLANWIAEDAQDVLPPAAQMHLAKLRGRVQRLENLLNDLLLYSRAGRRRHAPEEVDTLALVNGVLELLNRPPSFQVRIDGELPTIRCERPPLEIVLRNLVENAIKHHHDAAQGTVRIAAQRQGPLVVFQVSDDGPGIEPRYHERIFDVFQTLRPRDEVEGSGMGLAIVKKTVESAGGKIWLHSTPGAGSQFCFTWPAGVP